MSLEAERWVGHLAGLELGVCVLDSLGPWGVVLSSVLSRDLTVTVLVLHEQRVVKMAG